MFFPAKLTLFSVGHSTDMLLRASCHGPLKRISRPNCTVNEAALLLGKKRAESKLRTST